MPLFKSTPIRNNLITLIIVLIAIPSGIIVYSTFAERSHQVQDAIDGTARYASQVSLHLTQVAKSSELVLNTLTRLEIVQKHDVSAVNNLMLNLVSQYPEFSSFFMVDKSGFRWASTNPIKNPVSYRDRKYFTNAVSSGRFSSGEYAIGKVKGRPVFSFALPIKDHTGAISGVGVASIELDSLKFLSETKSPDDHLSIFVLDHKGVVLYNSTNGELNGTQEQEAIFRQIKDGPVAGRLETDNDSKDAKIISYMKLQLPGEIAPYMYVRSEISRDAIMKGPNNNLIISMTLLLVGMAIALVIAFRISERFLLNKVAENERDFRYFIENANNLIYTLSPDGIITYAAPTVETLLGYLPSELIGTSFEPLVHPEDLEACRKFLRKVIDSKTARSGLEYQIRHKNGKWLWYMSNASLIADSITGKPVFFGIGTDITERKNAEKEKHNIELQLIHAQKLESLGVMAGGIAHDFNNLLQAILGNIELAARMIDPDSESIKHISKAMITGKRAKHITNLMLDYVGKGFIDKTALDLNQLVSENSDMFKIAATASIHMDVSLAEELPAIMADKAQIQQLVMNLITNATEAISELPGIVRIITGVMDCDQTYLAASLLQEKQEPGCYVFLEVSDNGCGMTEEIRQRLFDPFFTTKFTGRGLGLSSVMGIMKSHAGALLLESAVGKGTTFRALFPAIEILASAAEHGSATPVQPVCPVKPLSGLALVVDDDKSVLRNCAMMVKLLGFRVIVARDGLEAISKFRQHADDIDVVLLDLTMPRMDGVAAMQEIYKIHSAAKILLASGFNKEELDKRVTGPSPAGFIRKPYSMNELEAEIRHVMQMT